jgi:hypothetical protein
MNRRHSAFKVFCAGCGQPVSVKKREQQRLQKSAEKPASIRDSATWNKPAR